MYHQPTREWPEKAMVSFRVIKAANTLPQHPSFSMRLMMFGMASLSTIKQRNRPF
jgi:hypothetical protein